MKQLLLLLFTLCTISASAQKPVIVNDKNGDKRISIGEVAYTIDAIKKDNDSFSLNDVYAVAKRVLGKRNVLVVRLKLQHRRELSRGVWRQIRMGRVGTQEHVQLEYIQVLPGK